jgi:hypothetical protein
VRSLRPASHSVSPSPAGARPSPGVAAPLTLSTDPPEKPRSQRSQTMAPTGPSHRDEYQDAHLMGMHRLAAGWCPSRWWVSTVNSRPCEV